MCGLAGYYCNKCNKNCNVIYCDVTQYEKKGQYMNIEEEMKRDLDLAMEYSKVIDFAFDAILNPKPKAFNQLDESCNHCSLQITGRISGYATCGLEKGDEYPTNCPFFGAKKQTIKELVL